MKTHPAHPTQLAAKVAAVNAANDVVEWLFPKISEALLPFVGQKLVARTPYFRPTAKVQQALARLTAAAVESDPGCVDVRVFAQGRRLYVEVRARQYWGTPGQAFPPAAEHLVSWGIALSDDHDLVLDDKLALVPPPVAKDWTVEEVEELQRKAEQARQAAYEATRALGPFA